MNKIIFLLVCFLIGGCSAGRYTSLRLSSTKKIKKHVTSSELLNNHLTGLVLFDLKNNQYVFDFNGDKYFTPGSNTKTWTLHAALDILGDSIAWMAYQNVDNRRVYFPMADPTFLHPFMKPNPRIENYFASHHEVGDTIYMSTSHFRDDRFGSGWMWDDINYYFQPEKSIFPFHANTVKINPLGQGYYPEWLTINYDMSNRKSRSRHEYKNHFSVPISMKEPVYMPIVTSQDVVAEYFSSLGLHLELVDVDINNNEVKIIYSRAAHDVYEFYMAESDNLIAEHLLLQCSQAKLGYMRTTAIIDTLLNGEFSQWKRTWRWEDGSGISRYNLVTPKAMCGITTSLIHKHGKELVEALLPAGGQGTLSSWYEYDPPRVFAKSGSVRYCHNLTGIVNTASGNSYTFSFMHNNFVEPPSAVKEAMAEVLDLIIANY